MFAPPMHVSCRVYDQGGEAHPDLDSRDLQTCLRARLAQQRWRLARQRRREQRLREEETAAAGEQQEKEEEQEDEESGHEDEEEDEPLFTFAPAHAGWLIKRGSGGLRIWRRRWVGLDANRCLWYGSGPSDRGAEGASGRMELTQWSRVEEEVPGGDALTFRVVPGGAEDERRAVLGEEGGAAEEEEEEEEHTAVAAVEDEENGAAEGRSSSSQEEGEKNEEEEGEEEAVVHMSMSAATPPSPRGVAAGAAAAASPPPPAEGWLFRAESPQEKEKWVARLRECIALAGWWAALRFGPALGEGGFSQVVEMLDLQHGERLAVKVMEARTKMERDQAVAETEILASIGREVRHPHLMAPRRVYVEGNRVWLMFPLCRGGDLFHALHARGRMAEPAAAELSRRLLGAVAALHAHGILHLDVKPENVLFASPTPDPRQVLLTDFGLSRRVPPLFCRDGCRGSRGMSGEGEEEALRDEEAELERDFDYLARLRYSVAFEQRLNGTIGYMSPEVVLHKRYGPAADVWSLGVVLHILLVGRSPWQPPPRSRRGSSSSSSFDDDEDEDSSTGSNGSSGSDASNGNPHRAVLTRSVKGRYSTEGPEWARVSEEAKDLVRRMLTVDDAERISTAEALAHPWLAAHCVEASDKEEMREQGQHGATPRGQRRRSQRASEEEEQEGAAGGEWGQGSGGGGIVRSIVDAVWCRGASFIARFSPRGAGTNNGGDGGCNGRGNPHSGSTTTFSSISSSG